jgi:4-amino-4-deoxy-L-arabinose transferase-like glycosyltransferase
MKTKRSSLFTYSFTSIGKYLIAIICLLGIALLLIPLESLISIGEVISPLGTLQEKTILLFKFIKLSFPILGACGLIWLIIPEIYRKPIQNSINRLLSSSWALPIILIISVLLRLAWIIYFPTKPYADSIWYFRTASELAAGQGYVVNIESHKPLASWPVGYPAFLAFFFLITGPNLWVAKIANVFLSLICVILTFVFTKSIFNRSIALYSAFIIAIFPGMIVYSSLVSTDLLFMTMTTLCFSLILKLRTLSESIDAPNKSWLGVFGIGLANGAMSLVRSIGLLLLPFWLIEKLIVNRKSSFRSMMIWSAFIVVGTIIILSPWTIRNYIYFKAFIPVSTNGGANFWIGNNPLAYGGYIFPNNAEENPLFPLIGTETLIDKTGYSLGLKFIKENPVRALQLIPAKLFYLINSNDFGLHWNKLSAVSQNQHGAGNRPFAITNLLYLIIVVIALIGIGTLFFPQNNRLLVWIGVLFSLYWVVINLPFFGQDRFMMPLWPILAMYSAVGFNYIINIGNPGESK